MKRKRRRLTRICYELDLPPEALAGSFGVHLVENCYAVIENGLQITELKEDVIRVRTENGEFALHGKNLTVEAMLDRKLCVRGALQTLEFR